MNKAILEITIVSDANRPKAGEVYSKYKSSRFHYGARCDQGPADPRRGRAGQEVSTRCLGELLGSKLSQTTSSTAEAPADGGS